MTEPLYYTDPSLLEFEATVLEVATHDDRLEVVLDRTAFYPEGGGQPCDLGTIGGRSVVHVRKAEDGRITHVLSAVSDPAGEAPLVRVGDGVRAVVDDERRRDYSQQHTGQHILSAALLESGGHHTVAVHLGEEYVTIEVDSAEISDDDLVRSVALANRVIEDDLAVTSVRVTDEEIERYPLRRAPKVSGTIRLLLIGDFDCVACGGVHVERTGRVRLIRALSRESIRGHARIAFRIGDRAVDEYERTARTVSRLSTMLSSKDDEVVERVALLEGRLRESEAEVRKCRERGAMLVAAGLLERSAEGDLRVVAAELEAEYVDSLRTIAEAITDRVPSAVCLAVNGAGRVHWCIAVSADVALDFGDVRSTLLPLIDGKGGGKPPIWQGVGAVPERTGEFLGRFERLVRPN